MHNCTRQNRIKYTQHTAIYPSHSPFLIIIYVCLNLQLLFSVFLIPIHFRLFHLLLFPLLILWLLIVFLLFLSRLL
jgi:hypothetical protein